MGASESRVSKNGRIDVPRDRPQRQYPFNKQGLKFHSVHGKNVQLSERQRKAKRVNSFCYGITFSDRPIDVNEKVYMKLSTVETAWSGVLRFGVTNRDPSLLDGDRLPRYACPDLTGQPGYWAKALPDEFAVQGTVLSFYVDYDGNLHLEVEDDSQILILISGIATDLPLWVMVDIYGNTTELEFIDGDFPAIIEQPETQSSTQPLLEPSLVQYNQSDSEAEVEAVVSPHTISRLPFSEVAGQAITFFQANHLAYSNQPIHMSSSIVFSVEPIRPGSTWFLKRLHVTGSDVQSDDVSTITIGVTSCNPFFLDRFTIPTYWNELLGRPEYWVFEQLQSRHIPHEGNVFSISLDYDGFVRFRSSMNVAEERLFYCDITQPLWMVIDHSSSPFILASIGVARRSDEDSFTSSDPSTSRSSYPPDFHSMDVDDSCQSTSNAPTSDIFQHTSQPPGGDEESDSHEIVSTSIQEAAVDGAVKPSSQDAECAICCETDANAAIYDCGHVCLCLECGNKLVAKERRPKCPICRKPIKDIIKLYHV